MAKFKVFIFAALFMLLSSFQSNHTFVFLETTSQRLHDQEVATTTSEILLNIDNGEMKVHYLTPQEFYIFTNKHGEMEMYYPSKNELMRQQNLLFSSENEPVYHFFNNQAQDLGLANMGFLLETSELDGDFLVSEWVAPPELMKSVSKAVLAQQDYLPVFVAYYNVDGKVKQKIYFSDWDYQSFAVYPKRITQIDFLPNNDSIISKRTYKNIHLGQQAKSHFTNIEIPDNAKLIEYKKQ